MCGGGGVKGAAGKTVGQLQKIDGSHNLVFISARLLVCSSWVLLMAPRTASIVNYDDNYCWILINVPVPGQVPEQTKTIITTKETCERNFDKQIDKIPLLLSLPQVEIIFVLRINSTKNTR